MMLLWGRRCLAKGGNVIHEIQVCADFPAKAASVAEREATGCQGEGGGRDRLSLRGRHGNFRKPAVRTAVARCARRDAAGAGPVRQLRGGRSGAARTSGHVEIDLMLQWLGRLARGRAANRLCALACRRSFRQSCVAWPAGALARLTLTFLGSWSWNRRCSCASWWVCARFCWQL